MSILQLRERLKSILYLKDSPRKIALSFAAGIFIGMSPIFGLHTVLGIAAAWVFRLNKFVTIVGVYITNPWTIIPIYTFSTWVGAQMLGIQDIMPRIDWGAVSFSSFLGEMKPLLWPFVVGTLSVGLLSAAASYVIVYRAVRRKRV